MLWQTHHPVLSKVLTSSGTIVQRWESLPMQHARNIAEVASETLGYYVFHVVATDVIQQVTTPQRCRKTECSVPSVVLFDMDQPFCWDCGIADVYSIWVPKSSALIPADGIDNLHARLLDRTGCDIAQLTDVLSQAVQHADNNDLHMAATLIDSVVRLLFSVYKKQYALTRITLTGNEWQTIDSVRQYIEDHLSDVELNVTWLANQLGLSRATTYRLFDDEGGLAAYILNRRLWKAAKLLVRSPSLRVDEAAFQLGFNSASTFTRAFTRTYGMNPKSMRTIAAGRSRTEGQWPLHRQALS